MPRRNEPIAVVGSACRFAGAVNSPPTLWEVLKSPFDHLQELPPSRFNVEGFYHENGAYHGHTNVRHAYLLQDDLATFDAEFFGVKPIEASAIDPQQRLLLEVVYEGVESAGFAMSNLRGSDTGVYVGVMFNDYSAMLLRDYQDLPTYFATGTGQSMLSNRISYFYDWHGPSVTVDTACSSSLVAVHMAVQALRSGESRVALACGTNLVIGPEGFVVESKLNMLSPDGRSRMWDDRANGYARGEGVAAVVLKKLSDAVEDGDHIECVIRETGLNQDGTTPGITIPSASAQEDLIRSTYAKAGLDLLVPNDRPQYFEAHGTGTPTGDPIEAEAIYKAFYTPLGDINPLSLNRGHPLYVGSIKTVLGHTEGAAGVAALLKASLAVQNKLIPPNLLFEKLSDRVAPFYRNMEILREPKEWPDISEGAVRRVSVNCFGFGGANAHAIVESFDNPPSTPPHSSPEPTCNFTPFVFSAFSETSLHKTLSAYVDHLEKQGDESELRPQDLAWTLREHRSVLPFRVTIVASSLAGLKLNLEAKLKDIKDHKSGMFIKASSSSDLRDKGVLGIFTGQGAQYPRMVAELIEESCTTRKIIRDLESYLLQIPEEEHRPSWSLEAELLADRSCSRVHEAEISLPLCTAVQIVLVDVLRLAGVHFTAVVGHSSGEIAAAYAAGYLTARDAICIAYYRGRYASLAQSPNGADIKGAMMAVGSSMKDMEELCADELFAGRVRVAANNSPSSVTVSGDMDAIEDLEAVLDDEDKFHRRLKVDKAYHSHHMLPCFDPYVDALRKLNIKPQVPSLDKPCVWFSSVDNGRPIDVHDPTVPERLSSVYWAENSIQPVLFHDAVSSAVRADRYGLVLEVGPHPALKAPATQTIGEILGGKEIPYCGVLTRGVSAVNASSTALGFLWSHLGPENVDLTRYERHVAGLDREEQGLRLVKGLPTYQWNHKSRYWHESRSSRKMRLRKPTHTLLGNVTPDSAPHHLQWRNLLRISEMEWLAGHAVQNQSVFPAAGYLATAIEASRFVLDEVNSGDDDSDLRLIEMVNFSIFNAIPFEQEDVGIEVLVQMVDVVKDGKSVRAKFRYAAAIDASSDNLKLAASADVVIYTGKPSLSLLPRRLSPLPHTIEVEAERFYSALAEVGYNFSGRFRGLSCLQRKRNTASGLIKMPTSSSPLLIHPAELDVALQSAILAYSYPYDEELTSLHLPTTIRRVRINPAALLHGETGRASDGELVPVDASMDCSTQAEKVSGGILADVNLYAVGTDRVANPHAAIQVQGVAFSPMGGSERDPSQDRPVYSKERWVLAHPDCFEAARGLWDDAVVRETAALLERVATFYLRKFHREVPPEHRARTTFPTNWYLNHARHVSDSVRNGKHIWWEDAWENDTIGSIKEASRPYMHLPDFQIMHLVGELMPGVFEGKSAMLEGFRQGGNDILDRYYANGIGLRHLATWVARVVRQITDRNPHMSVLEVGAGTGGATKAIFEEIDGGFRSYTYTDISAGFFEAAIDSPAFSQYKNKMSFKTLDIEKDPVSQGYPEYSYDLVIAFFVIHATSDLKRSLRNLRRLLKPGGYLIIGEGVDNGSGTATSGFIFGTLPGWWFGVDSGRSLSPLISRGEWDKLLRSTGFSGADATPPFATKAAFDIFPLVSQACDDQINFLREPMNTAAACIERAGVPVIQKLTVIGGLTRRSARLIEGLERAMLEDKHRYAAEVHHFESLAGVDFDLVGDETTLVCLQDLDTPIFQDITEGTFTMLKKVLEATKLGLWITSGRNGDEPFANMMVAFTRCAAHEMPDLRLQQIDIPNPERTNPETLAEALLRLHASIHMTRMRDSEKQDLFWTIEPEIILDSEGRQLVPRLSLIRELNERYNAGRRVVARQLDIRFSKNSVRLVPKPARRYTLQEVPSYETELWAYTHRNEDWIELLTEHAILSAIKMPFGHKFLILGVEERTGDAFVALAPSLATRIQITRQHTVRCGILPISNHDMLRRVAAHLVAMVSLEHVSRGQTMVVHNASSIIAESFSVLCAAKNITAIHTIDDSAEGTTGHHAASIQLPQYLSESELDDVLELAEPAAAFVGLSTPHGSSANEETMLSMFRSKGAAILESHSIFSATASGVYSNVTIAGMEDWLLKAVSYAHECSSISPAIKSSVSLEDLVSEVYSPQTIDPLCIVNWQEGTSDLAVEVSRLDAGPMFKGDECGGSTYWVVGMSGALGISLVDWMISRGATNVVVSSRRPDIAPEWIAAHRRRGATVTIVACDVTQEADLKRAHRQIRDVLPPIAGVIHGAMVLHDVGIANMSYAQFMDVVRPKVYGSIYLDRIFADVALDFFVLTSSVNTVIGNPGQANYAAANSFMCSLAAQRRGRGLRAAAVNGGAIIGAGYMERDSRRTWDRIADNNGMMRMSEEDFVQSVCEGIEASRLDAHGPEITTGLNFIRAGARDAPFWADDPRFAFFITHEQSSQGTNQDKATASTVSLQQLLAECRSQEEVYDTVARAFAAALRAVLRSTLSDEDLMASLSSDIGLDSLVSVNIRSWFLKYLQVNVPVLKIMGNGTMENLARFAIDALPPEMVPHLSCGGPLVNNSSEVETYGNQASGSTPSSDLGGGSESRDMERASAESNSSLSMPTEKLLQEADSNKSNAKQHAAVEEIDWEVESRPPAYLIDVPLEKESTAPKTPPGVVVLTGASGLYGRHLLAYLVRHIPGCRVICIAVRKLAQCLERGELPPPSHHIEYFQGDLESPLLGLTPAEHCRIFAEADCVIHNGANTSHMQGYRSLRQTNVGATLQLARSSLPRRVPLHYVSSAGLAMLYHGDSFPPVSVTGPGCALPAADGSFGYAGAKWACESLLERTHAVYKGDGERPWRVCIHRPSTIIREGADATGDRAGLDWLNAMLLYCRRYGTVPRIRRNRGALDLVSVRTACADLVQRVVAPEQDERLGMGEVGYVHQVGDMVIPLDSLHELGFQEPEGKPFGVMSMDDWIARAVADGLHPAVAALVEMMDDPDGPDYPRLLRNIPESE